MVRTAILSLAALAFPLAAGFAQDLPKKDAAPDRPRDVGPAAGAKDRPAADRDQKPAADKPAAAKDKTPDARRDGQKRPGPRPEDRETIVYRVRHLPAVDLAKTINEYLERERRARAAEERAGIEGVTVVSDAVSNSLIVTASPRWLQVLRQVVEQLDRPRGQLKLHVLLAEIAPPPAPAAAEPRDEKAEQRAPEAGSEVERRIAALKHQRRLHVVAEPLITVLDNQAAFFQVGRREPRVTGQTATPRGQVRQFSMEDVGTVLGVTPRIRDDGSVTMEMDVEASYLGPEAEGAVIAEGPDGAEIRTPPVQTIKLQTTVTARDGEAVVAGRFFADTAAGPRELLLVVKPEVTKPAP